MSSPQAPGLAMAAGARDGSPTMASKRLGPSSGLSWVRCVRVRQWTKNLLVGAAPLAAGSLVTVEVALGAVVAFLVFCLASAGCYLLNDAVDAEEDRLHPVKCRRPVAAGEIRIEHAAITGIVLMITAVVLGFLWEPTLGVTIGAYVALQAAYLGGLNPDPPMELVESGG